jgi:hypothetical protein
LVYKELSGRPTSSNAKSAGRIAKGIKLIAAGLPPAARIESDELFRIGARGYVLPTGIFSRPGSEGDGPFFRPQASQRDSVDEETKALWIYDFRRNERFTLKTNPLKRGDLDDFVSIYNPENRHERKETDRFNNFLHARTTKLAASARAGLPISARRNFRLIAM